MRLRLDRLSSYHTVCLLFFARRLACPLYLTQSLPAAPSHRRSTAEGALASASHLQSHHASCKLGAVLSSLCTYR